jgi:hypothetical protein
MYCELYDYTVLNNVHFILYCTMYTVMYTVHCINYTV